MIREKRNSEGPIIIDLAGPEGNAFYLLGLVPKLGKTMGWDQDKIEAVQTEMQSEYYENLIQVFDREFGDFVILEK